MFTLKTLEGMTIECTTAAELAEAHAIFGKGAPAHQETKPSPAPAPKPEMITVSRQGHDYEVVIDDDLRSKFTSWQRGKVGRKNAGVSIEDALTSGVYIPMALRKRMSANKVPQDIGDSPEVLTGNNVDFRKADGNLWAAVESMSGDDVVRFARLKKADLRKVGEKRGWVITWKAGKEWTCKHEDHGTRVLTNVNVTYAKKHNVEVDRSFRMA